VEEGAMNKEQIVARVERLVGQAYEVVQGRNDIAPEQVLSGALTVMIAAYGRSLR
jgi:hypothetical protein